VTIFCRFHKSNLVEIGCVFLGVNHEESDVQLMPLLLMGSVCWPKNSVTVESGHCLSVACCLIYFNLSVLSFCCALHKYYGLQVLFKVSEYLYTAISRFSSPVVPNLCPGGS
jgi:hypothetical protein